MNLEDDIRKRYPENFSEAETRITDRRCRCGGLLAERAPDCHWHAAGSADYARDLRDVIAVERIVCLVSMNWRLWLAIGRGLLKRTVRRKP